MLTLTFLVVCVAFGFGVNALVHRIKYKGLSVGFALEIQGKHFYQTIHGNGMLHHNGRHLLLLNQQDILNWMESGYTALNGSIVTDPIKLPNRGPDITVGSTDFYRDAAGYKFIKDKRFAHIATEDLRDLIDHQRDEETRNLKAA